MKISFLGRDANKKKGVKYNGFTVTSSTEVKGHLLNQIFAYGKLKC